MMFENEFANVLISFREPYSKNTLWIKPNKDIIEVNVFNKGWKTILTTKDLGLSEKSKQQVIELINESITSLSSKLSKSQGQYKNSMINLINKNKELENKISELENKIDKLTKRYGTLLVK